MALTEVYVDPSIAGDSGAGSSGDPYGDLEYALEQVTRDTSNGDRFNVKAGTDEVLEFALDIVTDYGTPTEAAPLVFQGYTTAAGDGGIGGISGGGSVAIVDLTTLDYVAFIDLHLHNTGSAQIVDLDFNCSLIRCEIDNSTGTGKNIELAWYAVIMGCHIHNHAGDTSFLAGIAAFNYFENGANDFTTALFCNGVGVAFRNIVKIDGASDGISAGEHAVVTQNSIFSNAGTGSGLVVQHATRPLLISNNLVEGFSGAGGKGVETVGNETRVVVYTANSVYDNTTEYEAIDDYVLAEWASNETLSASPFTDAVNGDFSPVDTGAVKEGAAPSDFGEGQ